MRCGHRYSGTRRGTVKRGVREFAVVNLADGPPPARPGDLILCRQALQHLNAHEALRVLHHFSRTPATLLISTTYTLQRWGKRKWRIDENYVPQWPGSEMLWMDLMREPFDLPSMVSSFQDRKRPQKDQFQEWLGLWRLPLVVGGLTAESCAGAHERTAWRQPEAVHGGSPRGITSAAARLSPSERARLQAKQVYTRQAYTKQKQVKRQPADHAAWLARERNRKAKSESTPTSWLGWLSSKISGR